MVCIIPRNIHIRNRAAESKLAAAQQMSEGKVYYFESVPRISPPGFAAVWTLK
jgi:hypothetical protein